MGKQRHLSGCRAVPQEPCPGRALSALCDSPARSVPSLLPLCRCIHPASNSYQPSSMAGRNRWQQEPADPGPWEAPGGAEVGRPALGASLHSLSAGDQDSACLSGPRLPSEGKSGTSSPAPGTGTPRHREQPCELEAALKTSVQPSAPRPQQWPVSLPTRVLAFCPGNTQTCGGHEMDPVGAI